MNENLNTNLNEMEDAVYFEEVPVNEVEVVEETQQSPSLGEILVKGVVLGLTALAVEKGTEILIDKVVAPSATKLMGKIKDRKLRKQQSDEVNNTDEVEESVSEDNAK